MLEKAHVEVVNGRVIDEGQANLRILLIFAFEDRLHDEAHTRLFDDDDFLRIRHGHFDHNAPRRGRRGIWLTSEGNAAGCKEVIWRRQGNRRLPRTHLSSEPE
jgi:hypothetical protein